MMGERVRSNGGEEEELELEEFDDSVEDSALVVVDWEEKNREEVESENERGK